MSKRYTATSEWRMRDQRLAAPFFARNADNPRVLVTLESADIHSADGWDYDDGAYRVRSEAGGKSYRRAKTFYGETAWMDGQRMFNDIISEVECGR